MAHNVITPKQARAVSALLTQRTIEDAATAAGVNARTLYRWLEVDTFRAALHAAEAAAIRDALRALVGDLRANFDTMRAIRDGDESANIRLQAARALDASLLKWRELETLEERVSRLEAHFDAKNTHG